MERPKTSSPRILPTSLLLILPRTLVPRLPPTFTRIPRKTIVSVVTQPLLGKQEAG